MKLVVVFMLAALPLYCYAGTSGCAILDDVISQLINPGVSVNDYQEVVKPYVKDPLTKKAFAELKQCYLSQSNETLANYQVMMDAIYNSPQCKK